MCCAAAAPKAASVSRRKLSHMLARRSRVPASDMKDLRGFARSSSPYFTVRFKKNGLERPRFAVVVGTRTDRKAAERHRLKRQVAGYLIRQDRIVAADVVVTVLPEAAKLTRKKFHEELSVLLDTKG